MTIAFLLAIELEHRAERSFGQIRARAPKVVALAVSSAAALTAISILTKGIIIVQMAVLAPLRKRCPRGLMSLVGLSWYVQRGTAGQMAGNTSHWSCACAPISLHCVRPGKRSATAQLNEGVCWKLRVNSQSPRQLDRCLGSDLPTSDVESC